MNMFKPGDIVRPATPTELAADGHSTFVKPKLAERETWTVAEVVPEFDQYKLYLLEYAAGKSGYFYSWRFRLVDPYADDPETWV